MIRLFVIFGMKVWDKEVPSKLVHVYSCFLKKSPMHVLNLTLFFIPITAVASKKTGEEHNNTIIQYLFAKV